MFTEICALATICSCGTRAPLRENNTYLTEPVPAARGAAPRYPPRINRTEIGKFPSEQITHHSTPEEMRINRKSQACLPAYTTADRRAPKLFRPQKSSIAVVCLRSVLNVREDGSRTGSAIFVAKKRRKQPLVN